MAIRLNRAIALTRDTAAMTLIAIRVMVAATMTMVTTTVHASAAGKRAGWSARMVSMISRRASVKAATIHSAGFATVAMRSFTSTPAPGRSGGADKEPAGNGSARNKT